MNGHLELLKGFGVSLAGFAAWAISLADIDSWVGRGAAVGGFLLVWLTIAQKLRQWRRASREEENE